MRIQARHWKIAAIVAITCVVDIIAHMFGPGFSDILVFNELVNTYSIQLVASVYLLVVFSLIAIVFTVMQDGIPGTGLQKGLRYGLSVGGVWYLGIVETSVILGTDFVNESLMALADVGPLILMGLLLGVFTTTDEQQPEANSGMDEKKRFGIVLIIIATVFVLGRYFAYAIIGIESAYLTNAIGTLAWTVGMGFIIGIMYWLLSDGVKGNSIAQRAVWFTVVTFGTNWIALMAFMPLMFVGFPVTSMIIRIASDFVFLTAGILLTEKALESMLHT